MIDRQQMSARYEVSRNDFLEAITAAGGALRHYRHPLTGPCGEPLFLDLGVLGNTQAKKLIFIASGTHGIEGYLGSELQTALLSSALFEKFLCSNLIVFVHGVNPFGMAWHRRVNEHNVDLNRNFIDFSQQLPFNEEYDLLSEAVNPIQFEPENIVEAKQKMTEFVEQHGVMRYIKALSGGQYHFPEGVQYGGQQAQWSTALLNDIWDEYVPQKNLVLNIDLHSGLGDRGEGVIMINGDDNESRIQRVQGCWEGILLSPPPKADDFIMTGVLGHCLESKFPTVEVVAAVLEFGTEDMQQVASAMIADNWLQHHGDVDSDKGQRIKQQILDAFYIDDDHYRAQVYKRTEEVIRAALKLSI